MNKDTNDGKGSFKAAFSVEGFSD